jgi:hypothetical protein
MTQQHPIAVATNGRNNPDRTGVVSGDRHRHILTHADLPPTETPAGEGGVTVGDKPAPRLAP